MKKRTRKTNSNNKIKKTYKNDWREALDSVFINDDQWWCIVTMIVETIVEHIPYVSLFNEATEEKEEMCIYSLSYQKAIDMVRTLSKQDPEKCPAIQGICHYANMVLNENNGHLSTWLIARITKYLIYRAKMEHVGRLKVQADVDHKIEEKYGAIRNIDTSNSSRSTVKSRTAYNSRTEYTLNGKEDERLNVNDVPFDGPNLYIVLNGFHDPDLPAELLSVGVPLVCILEIKLPNEQYIAYHKTENNDSMLQEETHFHENYHSNIKNELLEFWTVTHERFANLLMYPIYSNITILTFRPQILPTTFNENEKEVFKHDIYDKLLLILYHLYDLCRQHAKYLKSMKLEKRIKDKRNEKLDKTIYENVLSDIPNEYVNVPLILSAILLQVESNLATFSDGCFSVNQDTGLNDVENTSTTSEQISVFTMQDKLKLLDRKYELSDEYVDSTSQLSQFSYLKVIPYGNVLSIITRHFFDHKLINLDNVVLRVLRDPRIIKIWQNHEVLTESKIEMYNCHIDNIAQIFNQKQTVSREEIIHYLHLLMFDKMIFSEDSQIHKTKARLMQNRSRDKLSELKFARSMTKRAQSMSNLTSPFIASSSISSLRCSKSDTEIDYDKSVNAFTECPLLFTLTDIRETLLPGYLYENVLKKRSYERASLEEYEDVELFSDRVFLQVAHECFESFDRFAARYFEPTDSMLLYFSDDNTTGSVSDETRLSSIRTPIGLREFCEYVVVEEEDWIKRERETCQSRGMDLTGRFMKKSVGVKEDAIIFDDEYSVLPDSLKTRELRKSRDRNVRKKISETMEFEGGEMDFKGKKMTGRKLNEAPMANNGSKRADGRVMGVSMMEKKANLKIDDVDTSVLPAKKILSSQRDDHAEGEPYDFVGYDLGCIRVQVIYHSKKFLLGDDTSVRVELENWLHGDLDLRVAVTLRHCTLRLSSGVSRRQSADTFHLTTKRGIVLGFCRNRRELDAVQNSSDCRWRNLAFDFRASWPSGLLIEPTVGDGIKNPFYIRQSYVSKRPEYAGVAREVHRNFLRHGTVLKYLDDNTVVIFRSNGVIVTCMEFDKPQSNDESIHKTTLKKFRIKRDSSKQSMVGQRTEKVVDSMEFHSDKSDVNIPLKQKQNILSAGECIRNEEVPLITEAFAAGKVLRYSVVNYDGRHYEVLNDLVVSEHDRLLVRATPDYEVNEIFTQRSDDTDTLLCSNGELIVTFSDGTSIITSYTIEEQPVICDWSDDELQQYFGLTEMKEYSDRDTIASSSNSEFWHEDSPASYVDYREELTRVSITDGFVSILLTYRMEHKDYATVSYDQSAVKCTLSMLDNLCVSISRRGHYEVSMGDEVSLKIRDDDVVFSKICTTCDEKSISTFEFWESSKAGPQTILTTIDILGNVLEVKSDGTTRYHSKDYRNIRRHECNDDVSEREEERSGEDEEDANLEARIHCKHERYCETPKFPVRSQYRIFAMNRDLTACEYLHRSVRCEQEMAAVFGDETSMIQYPISRRPELRRLITFVPVEPELGSKEISCQYRVTSYKRMNYRTKLPRSTYSFPNNWLFPFGKKDQRVSKRTQNEVLAKRNEQPLSKLLRVRVFFGIKEANRSVLIDMQRVMGRYWISVFRDGDKCRLFYATGRSRPYEVENDYNSSENDLRELALGVKESIDVETYVRSLRGKLIKVSTKAPRQSSRLVELLRQRGSMKEEYEWYKQCMRKRIILPYFQNIVGSCYVLVQDLVDEAIRISMKSQSCMAEKEDELINSNKHK